jgi:hypothetical protein
MASAVAAILSVAIITSVMASQAYATQIVRGGNGGIGGGGGVGGVGGNGGVNVCKQASCQHFGQDANGGNANGGDGGNANGGSASIHQ